MRQIGGNHYEALAIHPRQLAVARELGCDEFSIVKYITRWRAKDGVKDLRKCLHFIEFVASDFELLAERYRARGRSRSDVTSERYITENQLPPVEGSIVTLICHWSDTGDRRAVQQARIFVLDLIHEAVSEAANR